MSNSTNNNTPKLVALVLVLLALAGVGYQLLSGKSDYEAETPAPVAVEQTEPVAQDNSAPTPEPAPVVVETKTLNLPPAADPQIPTSDVVASPEVEKMMGIRAIGSNDAPIKVVEYSSLTCGHCSSFHKNLLPQIKANYIDTGKVQLIFKEFPLNKPAIDASKLLRCMPEDKFVAFQELLFSEQEKWAYSPEYLNPLKQNAKLAGLSEEQIESCLNNKELENRIIADMKAGSQKYNIQSTPTFVVNDGSKIIVGHQNIAVFDETFNSILNGTDTNSAPTQPQAAPVQVMDAPAVEEVKQ